MRKVNKLDSDCHSIIRKIKLELLIIFAHQETGSKQIIISPHFPCGLNDVTIRGLNFKTLALKIRINSKKYKPHKNVNQNHHQYCHCVK